MSAAAAAAALGLAWWTGAWWPALAVATALWAGAVLARGVPEILLLVAAPVALLAATPSPALVEWRALSALGCAALGIIPLLVALGPGVPGARAAAVLGGSLAAAVVFALTPPGAALAASDLSTGATTLALAAGALAASSWAARASRRG